LYRIERRRHCEGKTMTTKTKGNAVKWSDIKKNIQDLSKEEMLELVKDLYDNSKDIKIFLGARFCKDNRQIYNEYKEKVIEPFYPKRGSIGKLKFAPARKAIRDYKKATNDLLGTLDLMLTYVESGTKFTCAYGDIDENFYNSLESVLSEFSELISSKSEEYLETFRERLEKLMDKASDIGWGYGDTVGDIIIPLLEKKD
jgi:hypothetical protein